MSPRSHFGSFGELPGPAFQALGRLGGGVLVVARTNFFVFVTIFDSGSLGEMF